MKYSQFNFSYWALGAIIIMIVAAAAWLTQTQLNVIFQSDQSINGLMMLIEFESVEGVLQWEKELDSRNLTALVKVQDNIIEDYPEVFKRLANKGYEIAGSYSEAPFWDMPYEQQFDLMQASQQLVEVVTGKKMRLFGSRYFSYDENTLKAADALGIEYILARGTQDVEAVIYNPDEYKVKIISVTNVDLDEMGRGSLCDYSLWARGSTAQDFGEMLDASLEKNPQNMILVSHAYLGGTRKEWWIEYRRVLASDKVVWRGFNDWLEQNQILALPNADIPINREVKYVQPNPAQPMEAYESISGLEEPLIATTIIDSNKIVMFHNNRGQMCFDALAFFEENELEVAEYLDTEVGFRDLLNEYIAIDPESEGVSDDYAYFPMIFYQGKGYSGFDAMIQQALLQ